MDDLFSNRISCYIWSRKLLKIVFVLVCLASQLCYGVVGNTNLEYTLDTDLKRAMEKYPDSKAFLISAAEKSRSGYSRKNRKEQQLDIYCYHESQHKGIHHLFSTAQVNFIVSGDDYQVYQGKNSTTIFYSWQQHRVGWSSLLAWSTGNSHMYISSQEHSCVGIDTLHAYELQLFRQDVDPWLLSLFFLGVVTFFLAPQLSRNVTLYYVTGVSIGVLASVLVAVFILSRFIPFKRGAYAMMLAGWSCSLWLIQIFWDRIYDLFQNYFTYMIGYLAVSSVISFSYCYYRGPVTSVRAQHVIQGFVQLFCLFSIYYSIQIEEAAWVAVVLTILTSFCPCLFIILPKQIPVISWLILRWYRWFPKKRKLLTEEEFLREGNEVTKIALKELRKFCRSPECDAWKTVGHLSSPTRFAKFVKGDHHVSHEEFSFYENSFYNGFSEEFSEDEGSVSRTCR